MSSRTLHIPDDRSVTGAFTVRTVSTRRYVVIDTASRCVIKRTENRAAAERAAWKGGHATIVLDTAEARPTAAPCTVCGGAGTVTLGPRATTRELYTVPCWRCS